MKCMFCGCLDDKVIDSRVIDDGTAIRRRRECINCGKRFTTYEKIETTPIMVIKSSGVRQAFDRDKIKAGIIKACEKRPISMQKIDELVDTIEKQVLNTLETEVPSSLIGELVMEGLKKLDEVAYVRFAAVYRSFKDVNSFLSELESLVKKDK